MQLLAMNFHMSWRASCSGYVLIILYVHLAWCKIFLETSLVQNKLYDVKTNLNYLENCNWGQEQYGCVVMTWSAPFQMKDIFIV